MYSARQDWKPYRDPGYTGNRRYYDDREKTNGWFSLMGISFIVGAMLGAVMAMAVMV